ncbi:MAG: EfeM/EfeO family lipoprotein [Actinobacteria bacterium]|nr:EfeM/EfeO family lipoprotein [Actinomycetota bacterium]
MPRPAARPVAAALLVAALVLSGCSSDDEPAASPETTAPATTAPTSEDTERGLTAAQVAGDPADDQAMLDALASYQAYVQQQAGTVARDVARFTDAVRAGDVELAKQLYPASRQAFVRIEPLVPLIAPGVASKVARDTTTDPSGDEATELAAWPKLEQDLWETGDLSDSAPVADELDAQLATLAEAAPGFAVTPRAMVLGARMLMAWAAQEAASGAAQPYSHTDMWDLAARLDGANAARQMFAGVVAAQDPEAATAIDDRAEAAIDAVAPYRTAEGWKAYDGVTEAQREELAAAFQAFADAVGAGAKALGYT